MREGSEGCKRKKRGKETGRRKKDRKKMKEKE